MSRFIRSFFILLMLLPALMTGFTLVGAQDDTTQIEIIGVIDAMTSTSITINGLVIDISLAEINTPLAVGAQVKVQASLEAGALIRAREVNDPQGNAAGGDDTANPVDELEITGILSAINGTLYTIGGQVVDGSLAEIKPGVVVGAVVKAHVSISADGTWVARELEGVSEDDSNFSEVTQIEYVGTLNAIGADSILVDGLTFITVNAEMSPALLVGIRVHVEGTVVDGVLVAREVRPATADDNGNDNSDDNGNGNDDNGNSNDNSDDNGNDDNGNDNAAVCPPVMPNGWTSYTVRAGDSLSRIASITDTDLDDLIAVNCITNANSIIVGQVLFVERAPSSGGGSDDNGNGNNNSNDNGDDDNGNDNGDNGNSNDNGDDDNGNDNGNDNGGGDDDGGDNGNGNDD